MAAASSGKGSFGMERGAEATPALPTPCDYGAARIVKFESLTSLPIAFPRSSNRVTFTLHFFVLLNPTERSNHMFRRLCQGSQCESRSSPSFVKDNFTLLTDLMVL